MVDLRCIVERIISAGYQFNGSAFRPTRHEAVDGGFKLTTTHLLLKPTMYVTMSNPSPNSTPHSRDSSALCSNKLRLLILLLLTLSTPRRTPLLDLLSFPTALLISLAIALPRFLPKPDSPHAYPTPVYWSIRSKPGADERRRRTTTTTSRASSGVKVYGNGDVYEGELHKGRCSGSRVYCYKGSGRYEGEWVDDKYDGFGVETWARGSRYRGQYRQGMRHGDGGTCSSNF